MLAAEAPQLPPPPADDLARWLGRLPAVEAPAAKAALAEGRRLAAEAHAAGASGHTVVRLQSALMDRLVTALFARAQEEAAHERPATPLALVALGGYGRRELAPYSDVDLLVLHPPGKPDAFAKLASERFLYALWDLKLEVGYAVRDVAECERLAAEDHTARTALLDLRHLAGDARLYAELERAQLHEIPAQRVERFIEEKLDEIRARRERYGDSLYLLEPNVKQSEGGLRDLQAALWIARARFKVAGLTELLKSALLPEREVADLRRARDFVWRVRNALHYAAGRKVDQLTFDMQREVASDLGYRDAQGEPAVEELMRHWYLAARTIVAACDAIVDRATEASSGKPVEKPLPGGELKVFRGRLTVTGRDVLRDPAALVRLVATADRENLDLYPFARDAAAQAAGELTARAAADPEVSRELVAAFIRPGSRGRFLWLLHEVGALPKLIPEFSAVTARRQNDVYHVYTVDVHLLFAVRRIMMLRCGDLGETALTELARSVPPLALYLGTLFHDIGKGQPSHSEAGARIAAQACARLAIDPEDAADVEWMVLKHLRMSHLAQRRDLSDPELIHDFAEECGTLDRLVKLYLMTYADMCSVGPSTWTDWKGRLLRELFEKTRDALAAGAGARPPPGTLEQKGREAAVAALAGEDAEAARRFVAAMPARYFLTVPPGLAKRHLRLLEFCAPRLRAPPVARGRPFAALMRHRPTLGHSELTVAAQDRPGLLSIFAGALAAHRIDVQRAEVFSTADGRALDFFEVRGPEGGAVEPARWRAARADLRRVLGGELDVASLVARRLKPSAYGRKPLPRVPTKIAIDNDSSRRHSVVDVYCADRPGLLYTLSRAFFDLGLSVDLARISTEGHRAADAFYVARPGGGRLEGPAAERVVQTLSQALARP